MPADTAEALASIPQEHATEYVFPLGGRDVHVSRCDHNGRVVRDGAWCVWFMRGSMNPWYLSRTPIEDGPEAEWRYKVYSGFPSADMAYAWARAYPPSTVAPYNT